MDFICEELSITDDRDFGCTIEFSDTKSPGYVENQSNGKIIDSHKKYFVIQRSYPEELFENDYYYIESSESDTELGYRDKIIIYLKRDKIRIEWCCDKVEIGLKLDEKEFVRLRRILKTRFKEKIILFEN